MKESHFSLDTLQSISYDYPVISLSHQNGQKVTIVATAHVSKNSVRDVKKAVNVLNPDCIAVELDKKRLHFLEKKDYRELNIFQILKSGQGYFFLAQLLLAFYQKFIANKVGSEPGGEMKEAVILARKKKKKLLLIDRPAEVTLRRVIKSVGFLHIFSLIKSFLGLDEDSLSAEKTFKKKRKTNEENDFFQQIESLNTPKAVQKLREKLRRNHPKVVEALLDERDFYMAKLLEKEMRTKKNYHILAVVGAAHARGIIEALLGNPVFYSRDIDNLLTVPPKGWGLRFFSYGLVCLIVGFFVCGFIFGEYAAIKEGFLYWFLANGILSALGAAVCGAHPLTMLSAFIVSPFTSLNPALPTGVVCAMVETFLRPPKIDDFEKIEIHSFSFRSWWHNRLAKIFLIFFFTNLGSALGTWISLSVFFRLIF